MKTGKLSNVQSSYSCDGVVNERPVRPLHHLISIIICEHSSVVLQRGAAPEDHLRVEAQGSQRVRLLQPVTPHSGPVAFWDTGGDGEGIVLIALLPGTINRQVTLHAAVVTVKALEFITVVILRT